MNILSVLRNLAKTMVGHWVGLVDYIKLGYICRAKKELSRDERFLLAEHSWYHDFEAFGLKTNILKYDGYIEAQEDKQDFIFELTNKAIDLSQGNAKGCELFCADGFYSIQALTYGADYMYGIDLAEESGEGNKRRGVLQQAELIAKILGYKDCCKFEKKDVFDLDGWFDFCICAGGLYHIENPEMLLRNLTSHTK